MSANTEKLLNRLRGTSAFKPMTVATFADWSLDAGDVITVRDAESGEELLMPLFHNDMSWDGAARGDLSCTGEEKRPVEKQEDRDEQRFRKATNKKLSTMDSKVTSLGSSVSSLQSALGSETKLSVLVNLRVSDTGKLYMEARQLRFFGSYGSKYDEGYVTLP